jgi:hypothetical protein
MAFPHRRARRESAAFGRDGLRQAGLRRSKKAAGRLGAGRDRQEADAGPGDHSRNTACARENPSNSDIYGRWTGQINRVFTLFLKKSGARTADLA